MSKERPKCTMWGLDWEPLSDTIRATVPEGSKDLFNECTMQQAIDTEKPEFIYVGFWPNKNWAHDAFPAFLLYIAKDGIGQAYIAVYDDKKNDYVQIERTFWGVKPEQQH